MLVVMLSNMLFNLIMKDVLIHFTFTLTYLGISHFLLDFESVLVVGISNHMYT